MSRIKKVVSVFILSLLIASPLCAVGEGIDMPVFNKTLDQFQSGTKPNIGWWQYERCKHMLHEAPPVTLNRIRIRIEDQGIPNFTLNGFRTHTKYNMGGYAHKEYQRLLEAAPELESNGRLAKHFYTYGATSGYWIVETIFGKPED